MRRFHPSIAPLALLLVGLLIFTQVGSAQEATPGADLGPPSAVDCDITPRTEEEIAALAATPDASSAEATPLTDLPDGAQVDDATLAGIERTLRAAVACAESGDLPRLLALYTDAAVQRLVLADEPEPIVPGQPGDDASEPAATPNAAADRTPVIIEARLLPDGRVAALVTSVAPGSRVEIVLFAPSATGEAWLIDEVFPVAASDLPATPESGGGDEAVTEIDEAILTPVLSDAAARLGVTIDEIELVSVIAREFSDSSLDCPQPDEFYAQVITPGYQIIVAAGGQQLDYRADLNGVFLVCEG